MLDFSFNTLFSSFSFLKKRNYSLLQTNTKEWTIITSREAIFHEIKDFGKRRQKLFLFWLFR